MKRFPFLVCLAFLVLLVQAGIASAADPDTTFTTTATTAETTAALTITPDRIGGSIYFETYPPGAMIWLDNKEIGTSPFTYYSEVTGTFDVRAERKGYDIYTGTVIVSDGKRVVFKAVLRPVSRDIPDEHTPVVPVSTVTTVRKSTIPLPTPWPTSPASPVDPAIVLLATALGIGFFVIRRW